MADLVERLSHELFAPGSHGCLCYHLHSISSMKLTSRRNKFKI